MVPGRTAHDTSKLPREIIAVPKTAGEGDVRDAQAGAGQQFASFLDAQPDQIIDGRTLERLVEGAQQSAFRHLREGGELGDGDRFAVMAVEVGEDTVQSQ